jgi:pSer/pThr/pTyr-binding forkhead associated (FHA) protein
MSKYSLEEFLAACGATGPLRLSVEHQVGADRYLLNQPFAVVGRDSRADLRVADLGASRRHLYFQVLCGRLLCLDFTTSSPDGKRQPLHRWVGAGGEVRLGSSTVRLIEPPGTASPREISPHLALHISGSGTDKAELRVRHPLVLIGQAHECQVRLRDERVSRFHCALVNTTAGLWVVDLLGRGGVTLNGVLVRCARFDDGDELGVGGAFTIQLQPRSPVENRPPEDAAVTVAGDSLPSPPPEILVPAVIAPADEPQALVPAEPAGPLAITDVSAASMALAFGRMQQQMAEQFHMTMTRVLGTFREIHRDQMKLVWQELAHVQKLTDELFEIKSQLQHLRTEPSAKSRDAASLPPATPSTTPAPVAPSETAGKPSQVKPLQPRPVRPAERPAGSASTSDVHSWLSGRVDAIQKERDGRWQKIFNLLGGSSPPAR